MIRFQGRFQGRPPGEAALVVSGGDGTLFHLLNRLRPPYPPVVLVASGRGNALARDLKGNGEFTAVDLMAVTVQPAERKSFTCVCGSSIAFGYPYTVTERALWFRKIQRLSYAAATAATRPRRSVYEIETDGKPARTARLTGVLVNNTRHVGGFEAFPRGSCRDGRLEMMELSAGYASQMAHNLSSMGGTGLWMPARVSQIVAGVIRPETPMPLMLDGELLPECVEVRFRVMSRSLQCLAII